MAFFKELINKLKGNPAQQQDVPVERETFREKVGDFRETLSNKLRGQEAGQMVRSSRENDNANVLRREFREQVKPTWQTIKDVLQATPRAVASSALTTAQRGSEIIDEKFQGSRLDKKLESMGIKPSLKIKEDAQIQAKTGFGKAIIGERPVRTTEKMAETTEQDIKDITGKDIGKGASTGLVFAGTLLDLVPGFGGSGKKALDESLSAIAKANKAEDIVGSVKDIFKTANVSKTDDEIMAIAKNLENVTDEKQIADELATAIKGTNTIKQAKESGKTFDEWVKEQGDTVYHGTNIKGITELTAGNKSASGGADLGEGLYLTTSKGRAREFGENIIETKVKGLNLKQIDSINELHSGKFNTPKEITEKLKGEGYDGVKFGNDIVIFEPSKVKTSSQLKAEWDSVSNIPTQTTEQIVKSADDIDVTNDLDTLYKADVPEEQKVGAVQKVKDAIKQKVDKFSTKFREVAEDAMILQKKIEANPNIKISDSELTPWERKQLYRSRLSSRMEELNTKTTAVAQDIVDSSKKLKIGDDILRKDVNDYLVARHAPERNLALGQDGAAGIKNADALLKLDEINAKSYSTEVKRIATQITKLNEEAFSMLKENGIISDDLYKSLKDKYKNHVPLNRIMDDELDKAFNNLGISKELSVKGPVIKRAKGSQREVEDILTNVAVQYEKAIIASEKNLYASTLSRFAKLNEDSGLFKILSDGPSIRYDDPLLLGFRDAGKQKWIKINNQELAAALKGTNVRTLGAIEEGVALFTRTISQLFTRFSPNYWLSGFIRDTQETMLTAVTDKNLGAKSALGILKKNPGTAKTIYQYQKGIDNPDTRLYKQFILDGGGPGGFAMSTKGKARVEVAVNNGKISKATKTIVNKIDDINEFFENQNRFSVYKQALNKGLSRDKAALLAQESTINFSRSGTAGPALNAFYAFSNVAVQGSSKVLRAMKNNPKAAAGFMAALATTVTMTNEYNDSVMPDWRERVSKWDRDANLVIVLGEKKNGDVKYITVPISWGLKPMKIIADRTHDLTTTEYSDIKGAIGDVIMATFDAYNPLGGSDLMSTLTPTIGDVPLEISRNKKFTGSRIKPDTYGREVPESERYFGQTADSALGRTLIKGTQALASKGIEVSPADLEYAMRQLSGGPGKFFDQIASIGKDIKSGEGIQTENIPIASRFIKSVDPEIQSSNKEKSLDTKSYLQEQERTNAQLKREAEQKYKELSKLPKEQANAEWAKINEKNETLGSKIADIAKKQSLDYSSEEYKITQMGVTNGVRAKYIYDRTKKMNTREEKNAYIKTLQDKKIISDTVYEQIVELISEGK